MEMSTILPVVYWLLLEPTSVRDASPRIETYRLNPKGSSPVPWANAHRQSFNEK
jgi:hypothetical protein